MSTTPQSRAPSGAKASLLDSLRIAPATVPALVAVALFAVWATSQAGYPVTHWAPGGLIVLALLGLALGSGRAGRAGGAAGVKIAVGCLAGYTVLSFASILWAAGAGGRLGRGEPDAALPARVRAVRALAPARAQRGAAAGGVGAGDDRAGGVRRAARERRRRQSPRAWQSCSPGGVSSTRRATRTRTPPSG